MIMILSIVIVCKKPWLPPPPATEREAKLQQELHDTERELHGAERYIGGLKDEIAAHKKTIRGLRGHILETGKQMDRIQRAGVSAQVLLEETQ